MVTECRTADAASCVFSFCSNPIKFKLCMVVTDTDKSASWNWKGCMVVADTDKSAS